ncbi:hypothetical protein ACOSQ2_014346 [Xanthoceras sorbifolium]
MDELELLLVVVWPVCTLKLQRVPFLDRWKVPSPGWFKINTDAALDSSRCKVGLGVVVRESYGLVLLSGSLVLDGLFSPKVAEALAILRGVQLALDSSFNPFCIESDAASVVHLISSRTNSFADIGLVVDDIILFLDRLPDFSIFAIRRSVNKVAHKLARFALGLVSYSIWLEDFPSCIASLVSDDIRDSL